MSKAPQTLLEKLHGALAQAMLDALEAGEVTAAHWSAISKFLKENGIDSLGGLGGDPNDAFAKLVQRAQEATSNMRN